MKRTNLSGSRRQPPWSVPGRGRGRPGNRAGSSISWRMTATRAAIAKAAGLAALPRLEAGFDLTRHGADGLRVVGGSRRPWCRIAS